MTQLFLFIHTDAPQGPELILPFDTTLTKDHIPTKYWIDARFEPKGNVTVVHLTAAQADDLKRHLTDRGGYVLARKLAVPLSEERLAQYHDSMARALRELGYLRDPSREKRDRLPYVAYTYDRPTGERALFLPDDMIEKFGRLVLPHQGLPPDGVFQPRTSDEVRTRLYNDWRRQNFLRQPFEGLRVSLRPGLLLVHVAAAVISNFQAERVHSRDNMVDLTLDELAGPAGSKLPFLTRTTLRGAGFRVR